MTNGNELKLFTDGQVTTKDGRKFTRLVGGFGKDKPVISDKQVAELLGYKKGAREVRERVSKNIKHFELGLHIIDVKKDVVQNDNNLKLLKLLDYTNMGIGKAKNIYIFSQAGFLLFLKFAEGDKAIEIYKNFIEDYFKTKAENKVLKITLKEQIDAMYEQYDSLYGRAIRTGDKELFVQASEINNKIIDLEKRLSENLTVERYKVYQDKYKTFLDEEGCFNFADASKILSTKAEEDGTAIRVNKITLPRLLRERGILSKEKIGSSYKNYPRSGYEKYFNTNSKIVNIKNKDTGEISEISTTQTKINKQGLDFIYNFLVKELAN